MNKLAELRSQIKEIEEEISEVQSELTSTENILLAPAVIFNDIEEPVKKNKKIIDKAMNFENIFHCLELAVCLLEDIELTTLTPQIRTLCDSLVSLIFV